MKRKLALVLAVFMLACTALPALAEESDPTEETTAIESQTTPETTGSEETTTPPAEPETVETEPGTTTLPAAPEETPAAVMKDFGQVDVSIGAGLELDRDVAFTVTLSGPGGSWSKTNHLGERDTNVRTKFEGLAPGEYTLTVTGEGFADYVQTIPVDEDGTLIQLMTGFLAGFHYTEGVPHPGVLQIGDVDGDGDVDETDVDLLLEAVDTGTAPAAARYCDLNGDGSVDLADMEYLAKGYLTDGRDTLAIREHFIPVAVIVPAVSAGTSYVSGSLDALLKDESSVRLAPADGEAISTDNPIEIAFDMAAGGEVVTDGIVIEAADDNSIDQGVISVIYTDEDGNRHNAVGRIGDGSLAAAPAIPAAMVRGSLLAAAPGVMPAAVEYVQVTQDRNGNIQVNLGQQVAVKKVTLTITSMKNDNSLAQISRVEFVNGMGDRIPEPQMDIPQNLRVQTGSKAFTLAWDPCVNITGYEVVIRQGDRQENVVVTQPTLAVTGFGGEEIRNYTTFTVTVRAMNGTWYSPFSEAVEVTPMPTGKPDRPDNVTATGGYRTVTVAWKDMKDTLSYRVYYRRSDSDGPFAVIPSAEGEQGLTGTSYVITGLEDATAYTVYVTGLNEFGESEPSLQASATTTSLDPAAMPQFNLINRDEEGRPGSSHITAATRSGGEMIDSAADSQSGTAWGTVDGDPASYYFKKTWDDGGFNNLGNNGISYTFDQAYTMDTIAILAPDGMDYFYAKIRWWDETGTEHTTAAGMSVTLAQGKDARNKPYYLLKLAEPITARKVQIGLARYWYVGDEWNRLSMAEVYFYRYDSLKKELAELYADDLHTQLKTTVTESLLNDLKARIGASADEFGHENPDKERLLAEWETAWQLLHDETVSAVVEIHSGISTNDASRGFTGLNAWQPLGVTAAAGDTITVYVGHNSKLTGENTNLQLVGTQYHAESSPMNRVIASNLKVGANEITVPRIWTTTGVESGGALYIQYTGNNASDRYAVRVSGGVPVPVLDLYRVTDESERLARVSGYLTALKEYAAGLETLHGERHLGGSAEVNYGYDEKNCILGATDMLLDNMLLSLPAQQVVKAGDAQTLLASLDAMEDMMHLFYQHKGLNAAAPSAVDQLPRQHLNIRYQRMFSGAFMYASGNHIGIAWDETVGMVTCGGLEADAAGWYLSGTYFGWGIAHEIGHNLNQGVYAVAEITNNYFAQLTQARDANEGMRFTYGNVYDKVTSGVQGDCPNIATQLALYWQLHLAYDKGYNFKTYDSYDEQLANLFFARVDTYARTPSRAPAPDGVALLLNGADRDQALMRLACAAAERNILEFFTRWGKTPDEETIRYAEQFEPETRAIYYANDDARAWMLERGGRSSLRDDGTTEAVGEVTVAVDASAGNRVTLTMGKPGLDEDTVLGYEIVRCTIAGGQVEERTVGFTTERTFTDTVSAMNNRAVSYKVTLVDRYLNRSAAVTTGAVKIEHKGNLSKAHWTVTTEGLTADTSDAGGQSASDALPCEPTQEDVSLRMVDDDAATAYRATVGANASIILDFHETQVITGFAYTASGDAIDGYTVEVRQGDVWAQVDAGTLGGSKTVYFPGSDGGYVGTYAADALRLNLTGQGGETISVAELDVLGVTGDNVDFRRTGDTAAIGILTADYTYGGGADEIIPAGSLVFTGSYKGSPAYNVVLLYDQDGHIVGGVDGDGSLRADQIILADVPETGSIQDVSDGTWIYWIAPDVLEGMTMPQMVRVELYRVNDATTNEGQRLVSDSLFEAMPGTLPGITLGSGN